MWSGTVAGPHIHRRPRQPIVLLCYEVPLAVLMSLSTPTRVDGDCNHSHIPNNSSRSVYPAGSWKEGSGGRFRNSPGDIDDDCDSDYTSVPDKLAPDAAQIIPYSRVRPHRRLCNPIVAIV